ncbi:replication protein A 70 kDa dna-binding subunit, partial [Trifolium medium]|nr:replication protein A 70 kDa dna-binding subunit [Trifolium medium]
IGTCIWDDEGRFVLAKTEWFSPVVDIDIGEAMGLLLALKWVQDPQLSNVDFELDSKRVVDKLHGKKVDISELGDIVSNCKQIFNSYFTNSRVEFIKRQANEAAHALANVAPSLPSFHISIDIPACIQNIIMNEML